MSLAGAITLGVVLVAAIIGGALWRRRQGQVRVRTQQSVPEPAIDRDLLTKAGAEPDSDVDLTLLQVSSTFCAPCRSTRTLLSHISAAEPRVRHVDVDVADHLELVRAFNILSTPTTVLLGSAGQELGRAVGVPRKDQVMAAISAATGGSPAAVRR